MMDTATLLFIFCLILIGDSHHLFSLIAGKNRKFTRELPIEEKNCRSIVECALYCQQHPQCKALNAVRDGKNTLCELLDKTPLNPKHLDHMEGSNYWEKTCQPMFGIEAANANKSGPGPKKVVITADGGVNTYTLIFSDTYKLLNVTFLSDTFNVTKGKLHKVSNSATMTTEYPSKSTTFLEDDGWMYCEEDGSVCPFSGEWPKRTEILLGENSVLKAFMVTNARDGFNVFAYDKVIEFEFPAMNKWPIRDVFYLNDDIEDHLWRNAPKNTVAAAWIDKEVERGHICKPQSSEK